MTNHEQRDAVRLDYGLSKYASLADAMDGAIREIAELRAARDELVTALAAITDEVAANAYSPGCEHMGPLVIAARAALTKAAPEQQGVQEVPRG